MTPQYKYVVNTIPKFADFVAYSVKQMIKAAQSIHKHEELDYKIIDNEIRYKEHDRYVSSKNYGYLTTFAYLQQADSLKITREKAKEMTGISVFCGYYSYAEILDFKEEKNKKNYERILGVTGTLTNLHYESFCILEKYIEDMSATPSMFLDRQTRLDFELAKDVIVEKDQ
jgi:hypothetical protein